MPNVYPDFPHRNLYTKHDAADGYTVESGRFILPVAEAPPTDPTELAAWKPYDVVEAVAPVAIRTVAYDTTKEGGPPKTPNLGDTGAFEFLEGDVIVHQPVIGMNGISHTWRVEGRQTYAVAGDVTLLLANGLPLQALPIPTEVQRALTHTFGTATVPEDNVIANSGDDVKACYAESLSVSFTGASYTFWGTSLYPGGFFSTGQINGHTTFV